MPSQRKMIFYLSRMEKLSYKEIAEIMGISVYTVQYHISTALSDLRDLLSDEPEKQNG